MEPLLAMSCLCKGSFESSLICNGFKDDEYVELALIARKLSLNTLGVRPVVGVRVKLRTKHSGHFGATSGEKGNFGLTTTQIIRPVRKLEQCGMLDCFELLHFHIGSQIPTTELLADGVGEDTQIYCELVRLGASMKVIDIGGGLGIDYDGSKSASSMFLLVILWTNMQWRLFRQLSCSESGRALESHHSVLIFEAVLSSKYTVPTMSSFDVQGFVERLPEDAHSDYNNLSQSAVRGDYEAGLAYGYFSRARNERVGSGDMGGSGQKK
ncbi:putative arginine decarboxylase [Helianthus annuus]|uniref:Arginine decarboxylase n=1 Tax=Helianthus annuus TaxID=4232 RepID=A0A251SBZ1_HELAN|nr:putative arginine decarboxylase [Helianthus annuus]KAJ0549291.1 putative arginine decarboxylase [Helianthus annuus]KAJ0562245.1 putative arginine decarboxylase [Helianthus annuus]KAJ0727621.1 putative arginine decarboxylase [Helianthus annuus]KAJ0730420.1 putative arginine decarboxylase [Helianthus annuus]